MPPQLTHRAAIAAGPTPQPNARDLGLGQLFVATRDAVVVGNVETGRIALWNPAAERLLGWTAAEAIGQPIELVIPAAIVRLHQQGLALYRHTGRANAIDSNTTLDVLVLTRGCAELRVELTLASLESDRPGNYVMAMLRDTSDRQRAEMQTLGTARAESDKAAAEQALRRQWALLQAGANDLQLELQRLQRSTQRLAENASKPPGEDAITARHTTQVRIVSARTARVRRMLDELIVSAGVEARALEVRPQRVNLVPLIGRVVADMRSRATPCRLNVAMPQGLTALADPRRIEQVVRTLLDQAAARNPRGCWIDIELRRPLVGLARLEVRDVGRPVTEAVRKRLFETSAAQRGLALCRYIVEQHGGTLAVELDQTETGGVRIVITLPTQRGRILPAASPS